jgi:uncharacterized membrane protein SpoIIM required for sporulation
MNRTQFVERNAARWDDFDNDLKLIQKNDPSFDPSDVPSRFRDLCHDLALANHRMYGSAISDRLNDSVISGYRILYRAKGAGPAAILRFFTSTFPQLIRKEAHLFWISSALFWLPFLALWLSAFHDPLWCIATLPPDMMMQLEMSFGSDDMSSAIRGQFDSDFMMFGYYVMNNTTIDFRIFAGGLLATLGTVFFLVYNGIMIGASAGYVEYAASPQQFWTWVAAHSAFELVGMTVAGMAGLRLGLGIVRPGQLSRIDSLLVAGRRSVPLIAGAAALTIFAAVLEGFLSPSPLLPPQAKWTIGIALWLLLAFYFVLAGRNLPSPGRVP